MAYFAGKDFFQDAELIALQQRVMSGDLTLTWFDSPTEKVRVAAGDSRRGLTYGDCNVGSYGYDRIPELIRNHYSMASRGSHLVPGLPDLGYTLNRKSDVWSENVAALYEEAKSRRWAPAVAVPWEALKQSPLPPEIEAAVSQLCTVLEEIALVLMEMPSRWMSSINQDFLELKSYLCAQMIDEARHVEVFRKRALFGGAGLKRASVSAEQALKEILFAETYPEASLACNVMLNSLVLGIFRHVTAVAPTPVEEKIFRLSMQDTGREIAYGVGHLRYHLAHQPQRVDALQEYLDRTEHTFLGVAGSPEVIEPLIVLSGGGTSPPALARGCRSVRRALQRAVDEYCERCAALGLERRGRSRLHRFFSAA